MDNPVAIAKDLGLIYRVNFRNVPLVPRVRAMGRLALKYFLDVYDAPISLVIGLTGKCSCACAHCGVAQWNVPGSQLPFDRTCEIVREYRALGGVRVIFTGGDPLLYPDLPEIIRLASNQGLVTYVDTTGTALDWDFAKRLRGAGLHTIEFSIDYLDERRMERNRKHKGILPKVRRAIQMSLDAGLVVTVNTVGFKENLNGELRCLIKACRRMGVHSVRVVEPVAVGEWSASGHVVLSDEEKALYDAHHIPGYTVIGMVGKFTDDCSGLNGRLLNVFPDGTVTPCAFMPLTIANVQTTPFREVVAAWRRLGRSEELRALKCPTNDARFRERHLSEGTAAGCG